MTSDGPAHEPLGATASDSAPQLSVPDEAVHWLIGEPRPGTTVLELQAGSGKFTHQLVRLGHRVIATDPSPHNLTALRSRVVPFAVGVAGTEAIPSPDRSVDVVLCNPTHAVVEHERALAEINRVLRPGGVVTLVWSLRDESVPWVRKLTRLIGEGIQEHPLASDVRNTALFTDIDEHSWRTWQRLDREGLLHYAQASGVHDPGTLAAVGALYDDYDRGPDGLQMPYVVKGLRATVCHLPVEDQTDQIADETPTAIDPDGEPAAADPGPEAEEPGTLLIDFT